MVEITADTSVRNSAPACAGLRVDELLEQIELHGLTEESLGSVLDAAVGVIIEHVGADRGCILLKDAKGALYCAAGDAAADDSPPAFSDVLMQEAMQSGRTVFLADAPAERPDDAAFRGAGIHSVLCAPIKSDDAALGVVYLTGDQTGLWDRLHAGVIGFLAGHLALALDNARLRTTCAENKRLVAAGKATLNLSHSVKNILQMVGGAAEVVDFGLRTNQIHRVKRSWEILMPNLDRMKKYTLEMLDYSKERPLNLGACDFNRVIQGAIESLKSQLKVKNSKINIRVDRKMPHLELDGERIHEMALNLILNAIDVVDSDGGLVSVETRYDAERQVAALSVTDNGPGMSDEMKEKIFTPFESEKKKFGTGLGMAIAKQIVDQHAGAIEIETRLHQGTTFTVSLPARFPTTS